MKKNIWDLYAPIYKMAMKSDEKIYEFMYDRIPKVIDGLYVLEIATGPGLLAKHVAHAANKMIATDYSDCMIAQAKKGDCPENLTFEVADATNLPFDDNIFDAVIIANALHIIPNPEKALSEIDRVIKPDGILIAPNFIHRHTGIGSRIWSCILKIAGIRFEHQWSEKEYIDFLHSNNWEPVFTKRLDARITMLYTECIFKGNKSTKRF